jgi:tetrahydromethanopterin S-methyltransferase subunit B
MPSVNLVFIKVEIEEPLVGKSSEGVFQERDTIIVHGNQIRLNKQSVHIFVRNYIYETVKNLDKVIDTLGTITGKHVKKVGVEVLNIQTSANFGAERKNIFEIFVEELLNIVCVEEASFSEEDSTVASVFKNVDEIKSIVQGGRYISFSVKYSSGILKVQFGKNSTAHITIVSSFVNEETHRVHKLLSKLNHLENGGASSDETDWLAELESASLEDSLSESEEMGGGVDCCVNFSVQELLVGIMKNWKEFMDSEKSVITKEMCELRLKNMQHYLNHMDEISQLTLIVDYTFEYMGAKPSSKMKISLFREDAIKKCFEYLGKEMAEINMKVSVMENEKTILSFDVKNEHAKGTMSLTVINNNLDCGGWSIGKVIKDQGKKRQVSFEVEEGVEITKKKKKSRNRSKERMNSSLDQSVEQFLDEHCEKDCDKSMGKRLLENIATLSCSVTNLQNGMNKLERLTQNLVNMHDCRECPRHCPPFHTVKSFPGRPVIKK